MVIFTIIVLCISWQLLLLWDIDSGFKPSVLSSSSSSFLDSLGISPTAIVNKLYKKGKKKEREREREREREDKERVGKRERTDSDHESMYAL